MGVILIASKGTSRFDRMGDLGQRNSMIGEVLDSSKMGITFKGDAQSEKDNIK